MPRQLPKTSEAEDVDISAGTEAAPIDLLREQVIFVMNTVTVFVSGPAKFRVLGSARLSDKADPKWVPVERDTDGAGIINDITAIKPGVVSLYKSAFPQILVQAWPTTPGAAVTASVYLCKRWEA